MPERSTPEDWELLYQSDDAELYRVTKDYPDGSGHFTNYRGRSYITAEDGDQFPTPEKPEFETECQGKEWFEERTRNPIGKRKAQ